MRRKCTDSLIQWKKNPHRHPLLLQGLRQTGKTWLALDFAEKNYKNTLYLNLETDKPVADYLSVSRPPLSSTAKMISILSACILWISRNSFGQMRNIPYPGKSADTSPP